MSYTNGLDKPSDYFNTKLYTGNGADDHAITGVNFQPDFVWIKTRSEANNHNLYDVIRGVNKPLKSNSTASEFTRTDAFKSFDSDGFTLDDDATSDEVNKNTVTYASWNWLGANGTASNSDGSITSTVSANTTAGFSIVSYTGTASTGATVGHGLGVKPDMIITKARAIADNWGVYHKSLGATKGLYLNTTNAQITSSAYYNNTEPTSTLVTLGDNEATNDNDTMIMYAFAEKKGYSKFGSYTGNGNANGTFVYTGMKPAFVMIKRTSGTQSWTILDNKRLGYNDANERLYPDEAYVEDSASFDFLSNGFKPRITGNNLNGSGETYIYMAFAENPFVTSTSIPCTAR